MSLSEVSDGIHVIYSKYGLFMPPVPVRRSLSHFPELHVSEV